MACAANRTRIALLSFVCVGAFSAAAFAQSFPDHPIRIILANPRGSGPDILGRYFAEELSKKSGQPTIVDNVDGGSSSAMQLAAKADPDGYTLMFASDLEIVSARNASKGGGVTSEDFTPIVACARTAFALMSPAAAPIKSVKGLVEKLKAKKIGAFGYSSRASLFASELFKQFTAAPARPISYADPELAAVDLAEGNLDFTMMNGAFAAAKIKTGSVKALAVTVADRVPLLPDTPTMMEAGVPTFNFAPWWGVYAPFRTPQPVVDRLEAWFLDIDSSPATASYLDSLAASPLPEGSDEARSRLAADIVEWPRLERAAGLLPQ